MKDPALRIKRPVPRLSATFRNNPRFGLSQAGMANGMNLDTALDIIDRKNKQRALQRRRQQERQAALTADERRAQLFRVANAYSRSPHSNRKVKMPELSFLKKDDKADA